MNVSQLEIQSKLMKIMELCFEINSLNMGFDITISTYAGLDSIDVLKWVDGDIEKDVLTNGKYPSYDGIINELKEMLQNGK